MAVVQKTIGTLSETDRTLIEALTVRRVAIGTAAEAFGRAVAKMAAEQQQDWNEFWARQHGEIPGSDNPSTQVDTTTGRVWIMAEEERPALTVVEVLDGSSTLPALIQIGDEQVQLGTIVAAAHATSGLSVEDWNALAPDARDALLQVEIERRQALIAGSAPTAPKEAPPAPADAANTGTDSSLQAAETAPVEAPSAAAPGQLDAPAP